MAGVTPMGERVAVLGLLNKRNGIVRDITLKPGQAIRFRDAVVRLRACDATAPWENDRLTGAFVQLDVEQPGGGVEARVLGLAVQGKPVAQRRRASGLRRLAQELRDQLARRARRAGHAFGLEQPVERAEVGRRQRVAAQRRPRRRRPSDTPPGSDAPPEPEPSAAPSNAT